MAGTCWVIVGGFSYSTPFAQARLQLCSSPPLLVSLSPSLPSLLICWLPMIKIRSHVATKQEPMFVLVCHSNIFRVEYPFLPSVQFNLCRVFAVLRELEDKNAATGSQDEEMCTYWSSSERAVDVVCTTEKKKRNYDGVLFSLDLLSA